MKKLAYMLGAVVISGVLSFGVASAAEKDVESNRESMETLTSVLDAQQDATAESLLIPDKKLRCNEAQRVVPKNYKCSSTSLLRCQTKNKGSRCMQCKEGKIVDKKLIQCADGKGPTQDMLESMFR